MRVAKGVEMLELSAVVMGKTNIIYPTLIWDDDTTILVDTGYPGQLPKIREAFEKAGVSFDKLNQIIITHHDIDHIGSLSGIIKESSQKIEVLSHAEEKPHIQGDKPIIKATPEALSKLDAQVNLPEEQRNAIKAVLQNPPTAKIDKTLVDGEEIPYCGGIIVIHTPGHTPGHICLYLKESKTLITGDALVVAGGQLLGPQPHFTFNMDLAVESLKKLTQYDIENVICYHGGLYKNEPNRRIAELAGEIS